MRAAGVREASGEETAGQLHSVAPRTMGKVALADASWSSVTTETEGRDALACADERAWRRMRRLCAWWRRQRCGASIRHQRARPCRLSRIGGPCEEDLGVVLS